MTRLLLITLARTYQLDSCKLHLHVGTKLDRCKFHPSKVFMLVDFIINVVNIPSKYWNNLLSFLNYCKYSYHLPISIRNPLQVEYPVYWNLKEFSEGFRKLLDHLNLDKASCDLIYCYLGVCNIHKLTGHNKFMR